jgi:hypothetical protein
VLAGMCLPPTSHPLRVASGLFLNPYAMDPAPMATKVTAARGRRKVEYTLAPGLDWSVLCYLDLETRRSGAGELVPAVVDYKVKTTPLTQFKADHDFQPSVYLAGRWLEGDPVFRMRRYSTVTYPGQDFARRGASF